MERDQSEDRVELHFFHWCCSFLRSLRHEANNTRQRCVEIFSMGGRIESREIREIDKEEVMMDLVLGKIAWMD